MRTALISTLERTNEGIPLAFLEMGGRNIGHWQVDMARRLGCTTIVCLGGRPSKQLDALAQYAEQAGAQFHLISANLQLVSHVTADQEIVVIADGVIIDRAVAPKALESGRGVLAVPAERGLAIGLERIDASHAWAGVLVARGQIVNQLADLPPDSDVIALMLRLSLQARTPLINLGNDVLADRSVMLALDETVVAERETSLLSSARSRNSWWLPSRALAQVLVRLLGPEWLGRGPLAFGFLAIAMLCSATGLSLFGWQFFGLLLLGLSTVLWSIRLELNDLSERIFGTSLNYKFFPHWKHLFDFSIIISLIGEMSINLTFSEYTTPILLVGILRLSEITLHGRLRKIAEDRFVWCLILGSGAALNILDEAMLIFSIGLVSSMLFSARKIG